MKYDASHKPMISVKNIIYLAVTVAYLTTFNTSMYGDERFPSTRVYLDLPNSFEYSKEFESYIIADEGVYINTKETVIPLSEFLKKEYSIENSFPGVSNLKYKKVEELSVDIDGHTGKLYKYILNSPINSAFYILFFGDEQTTVTISAGDKSLNNDYDELLTKILLGAKWKQDEEIDSFDGLPYRFNFTEKLPNRIKGSNGIGFTNGETIPVNNLDYAVGGIEFYPNYRRQPPDISDYDFAIIGFKKYSEKMNFDSEITDKSIIDFPNKDFYGIEIIGNCIEPTTNTPKQLFYTVIFTNEGLLYIDGVYPFSEKDVFLKEFRSIVKSIDKNEY